MCNSMDISSSQASKDRISELPDNLLHECLSLLEMKNAAQTSILGRRWRYMWTHWTNLDFDPCSMYPEEYATFFTHDAEARRYFAWINQVVNIHQGPCIDKFRVEFHYYSSCATQLGKWVKFALSKRVKELVLDLTGHHLLGADYSEKGFPLGFDMLRHPPCYSGITALQSLHLQYVNVSQEFIEFLLSHCRYLERLFLSLIPLSRLTVQTSKLKYLTILMSTGPLEYLEIDAENLLYFQYGDGQHDVGPRMVFKSLPKLVETSFCGGFCRSPFPIFNKLVLFSKQLYKISLELEINSPYPGNLDIPERVVIPTFPNVKHFTCTIICYSHSCILSMKRFIKACPMLEEFKLQVNKSLKFSCPTLASLPHWKHQGDGNEDVNIAFSFIKEYVSNVANYTGHHCCWSLLPNDSRVADLPLMEQWCYSPIGKFYDYY